MKRIRVFYLAFIFLPGIIAAQSFEGVVTYTVDVITSPQAAQMGITKATLIDKMREQNLWSDTETVTYKGGFYRTELLSPKKTWSIYRSDSNKIYSFGEGYSECAVIYADQQAIQGEIKPTITQVDTSITILNYPCKLIRVSWDGGSVDYVYGNDSTWYIAPALYKYDIYDGWYSYLSIAKGVPLQIRRALNGLGMTVYTAISIKRESVNDSTFALPHLRPDTVLSSPAINIHYMHIEK